MDWIMPASEAKAISEGSTRVRRALGLISNLIFDSAKSGGTFIFLDTTNSVHDRVNTLGPEELQTVLNILYDRGYFYLPIYNANNRTVWKDDDGKNTLNSYRSGHSETKILGYNIDWSGQYE